MAYTFTTPGLGPQDYGGKIAAGTSLPSYESIYNKENATTGGGFGVWGPISGGLQIAQGIMGFETQRKIASGYKAQSKQLTQLGREALEQGFDTAIDLHRAGEETLGEMTAAFGKSGSLMEGAPLLVLADTRAKIERNRQRVIEQARRTQREYDRLAKEARKAEKAAKKSGFAGLGKAIGGAFGGLFGGPAGAILGSQGGALLGQLLG